MNKSITEIQETSKSLLAQARRGIVCATKDRSSIIIDATAPKEPNAFGECDFVVTDKKQRRYRVQVTPLHS